VTAEGLVAPRAVNHVGAGVSDIVAAIEWYTRILGFQLLAGPYTVDRSTPLHGEALSDVFGDGFRVMKQAHLTSGNGVGLELFESVDPPHERRSPDLQYWTSGFFHICITDPDIEALAARIVATGGRQISRIWTTRPPSDEYKMCYCADPFGNILELFTRSYERMVPNPYRPPR
jgi:catechol 2,3-dioxygenase-like lactoylglutathione lyase family enzyme